ncbi:MAG: response regulator [Deltaproteobacteria bacterium]|nr:response regulator [Deltaproteobacteria bacterium]
MSGSVLVIEDDEDIVDNVRAVLEGEGYQVLSAANGRLGLDTLASKQLPAVILLDLMMPVMTGFEFRDAQQADPRIAGVPVVLMTADGHLSEKTARLGAAAALAKPFDIVSLLSVVARFAG